MQQNMHLKTIDIKIDLNLDEELKNIANKEAQYTIPIFIPHKGCKNECVFCNQRKISGKIKSVTVDDVDSEIKKYLQYVDSPNIKIATNQNNKEEKEEKKDKKKKIQVAFFGGSFTGISIKEQIKYLQVANKYIAQKKVDSIRLSTRPDYISPKILKLLKVYNVDTIELGVQSLDNEVLNVSKRGHLKKEVMRASRLINLYGFNLGHQLMIGLPNSNLQKELYSIKECLKYNPINLRIYPVYVINPSELYDMYVKGEYIPLTLKEAIDRTYEVIKACRNSDVKIIRIGLQSTDEITSSNEGLIGPVCDNFAEYVLSKFAFEKLDKLISQKLNEKINIIGKKDNIKVNVEVKINRKYISIVSGPKKINKEKFKEKYKNCNIDIKIKGV